MDKEKRKRELQKNRQAFREIIGNPFLDIEGIYCAFLFRSAVGCVENKYGTEVERMDAAKPSVSDFMADVDLVLKEAIAPEWLDMFDYTFIQGNTDGAFVVPKAIRNSMEQSVGKLLRQKGIYPVRRYFTVNR